MNIFKLMQAMRPYIQRGDMTYDLAVKYLKERGVQFDGIVKKALDNMFKKIKARDPVFDKTVTQMPIDDAGIPFNPRTFKSTTEKRGVENLFEETKRVNIPADKLNHQKIAEQAGIDVELIKGKDWVEILEVLKGLGKADGGRIGFNQGGWHPGVGRDDRGYKSDHPSHGGGGGNNPPQVDTTGGKLNISPVITYKDEPYNQIENVGLRGNIGKLVAAGVINLEDALTGNIDPTIAANLDLGNFNLSGIKNQDQTGIFAQGNIGPVNVGGSYQDFGEYGTSKNIGATTQLGNLNIGANYDFENKPNVGLSYNDPESGWSGNFNYDFEGTPAGMISLSKKFKKGGRVGYDAGGLTGQAKAIYDSWISAGHSSQDALDYLSSRGMYDAGGGGVENIINTQQSIIPGAGGSGGIGIQTPIGQNISNFQSAIDTRQNKLNNPGKIAEFAYSMGMPKQASVQELLARGMRGPKDTTLMSNIPFGISGLISKALPDMYSDMTLADQITTQAYMGYTDPNTGMSNKDPFGINVRSMFGNYAEKAAEIVSTLEDKLARKGELSKYDQARLDHYRNVTQTKQSAAADLALIELAKQEQAKQEAAKAAAQLAAVSELTGNVQTGGGKGIASSGVASGKVDPSTMGGGSVQAKSTGAQKTDRDDGGWGWAQGGPVGLATMFTRRR